MDENEVSRFGAFSPADYRYYVKELEPYLSEEAYVKYKSKVEAALASALARRGIISKKEAGEITKASSEVRAADVYEEEKLSHHDVIAQVNAIRRKVSGGARRGVHLTATSYDIIDSANMLRYKDAFNRVIIPDLIGLERSWIEAARRYKGTLQIGRTHLQHAEPVTFGFAMAWYVSRLGSKILKIKESVDCLSGKFAGAVGAYNASSVFVENPEEFEREILGKLGLVASEISTQIVQPEAVNDLIHHVISCFTIISNWADDIRDLERPEIGEVWQPRGKEISRSSTMPHKANPVGLENIKSIWKATMPYVVMMHLDQISDHQRDLTNSASQRYIPQILGQFDYSVRRAAKVSDDLKPDTENMLRNLRNGADGAVAEPLHLLLSVYGHPNSHEYVGKLADESSRGGIRLAELALKDKSLKPYIGKFTAKQMSVIKDPSKYIGIASKKAAKVAGLWKDRMDGLEKELR